MRCKKSILAGFLLCFAFVFWQSIAFSKPFIKAPPIARFKSDEIRSYILRHSSDYFDYAIINGDRTLIVEDSNIRKVLNMKLSIPKQAFLKEGDTFEDGETSLHDYKYNATYDLFVTSEHEDIKENWVSKSGRITITKIEKVKGKFYKISGEFNLRFQLLPRLNNDFITTGSFMAIISSRNFAPLSRDSQ